MYGHTFSFAKVALSFYDSPNVSLDLYRCQEIRLADTHATVAMTSCRSDLGCSKEGQTSHPSITGPSLILPQDRTL